METPSFSVSVSLPPKSPITSRDLQFLNPLNSCGGDPLNFNYLRYVKIPLYFISVGFFVCLRFLIFYMD